MPRSQDGADAIESTPLLQHDASAQSPQSKRQRWWSTVPLRIAKLPDAILVPVMGSITVFLNESEYYIKNPSQLRAIEAMACFEYYSQLDDPLVRLGKRIPELMCKKPPIADRVATIYGLVYTVRMLCAFMGTIAILAWFKGRRRRIILILHKCNVLGSNLIILLAYYGYPRLSIWFICLNGITALVGGNYDLGTSTIFAAYGDIIPDKTRRSNLIFMTTSFQYLAQVICLPLSGHLINLDGKGTTPEVALILAAVLSATILLLIVFLFPETYRPEQHQQVADSTRSNISRPSQTTDRDSDEDAAEQPQPEPVSRNPFAILRNDFGLLRVIFVLLAMLFSVTATRMVDWYGMMQYPSIKFHWSLSKTTYLVCMQGFLSFFVLTFFLPAINRTCQQKYSISAESTSVGITVTSALILSTCCVIFGLPGLTVPILVAAAALYTLGSGINSAVQAYIVNAASTPQSSGAALTIVSLAATAGKITASAIWPAMLHFGLSDPSGRLRGLPFFVNAVLSLCVAIAISFAGWIIGNRSKARDLET